MIEPTATQPSPNGNSTVDPTATEPFRNGDSTVIPSGISAVTKRQLKRDERLRRRRRIDSQNRFISEDFKPSGEIVAGVTEAATPASSSAPSARRLESDTVPVAPATPTSKSIGASGNKAESTPTPKAKPDLVPSMRTKGVVTRRAAPLPPPTPTPEGRAVGKQTKGERPPVPNWIAYKNIVFFVGKNVDEEGNWLGGKIPRCKVCDGWLHPQENHKCPGYMPRRDGRLNTKLTPDERMDIRKASWEMAGDWDDDQYDRTTSGDIHPVVKYGEEWDDDHYDHTTPGEIDLEYLSEYEDSGVVLESWDEDDWLAWKWQQLGYSKDYDPNLDAADEQLDWDHEEEGYEDYEE